MLKTRALQIAEAAKLKSKALRMSLAPPRSAAPTHAPSEAARHFNFCRNRDISTLLFASSRNTCLLLAVTAPAF